MAVAERAGEPCAALDERQLREIRAVDLQQVEDAVDDRMRRDQGGRGAGCPETLLEPAERGLVAVERDDLAIEQQGAARLGQDGVADLGVRARQIVSGARLEPHHVAVLARDAALAVELPLEQPVVAELAAIGQGREHELRRHADIVARGRVDAAPSTCDAAEVGDRGRLLFALGVALVLAVPVVGVSASTSAADDTASVTFAIADDAAQRAFPSELTSAHGVGIGAARAYVGWADIASSRPAKPRDPADHAYDWSQTDADMARYASAGLAVWIAFWRTPAWASGSSDSAVWPTDPKDLEDFAYAVARRYPQVHVFMDWNEPNLKLYAKPNTIEAYEPMARAVYAGVKAADPGAEVIAGNLARYRDGGRDPLAWASALKADAVPMDAFGIHPYPDVAKPLAARAPRARVDLFDVPALARIVGVPVAVTEFGWSSQLAGDAQQATWTAQAIEVARCTPGLSQFVFWGYHDHPVPAGETPDPWVRYGWLDSAGAPKPVFDAAHAALTSPPDCAVVAATSGAPAGWPATNTIPPTDRPPACTDASLSSTDGAPASADLACSDPDGDALTYTVTAPPASGTVTHAGSTLHLPAERGILRRRQPDRVGERRHLLDAHPGRCQRDGFSAGAGRTGRGGPVERDRTHGGPGCRTRRRFRRSDTDRCGSAWPGLVAERNAPARAHVRGSGDGLRGQAPSSRRCSAVRDARSDRTRRRSRREGRRAWPSRSRRPGASSCARVPAGRSRCASF